MGKRGTKGKQRFKKKDGKDWRDATRKQKERHPSGWDDIEMKNEALERYYKTQGILSEEEYKLWIESLRTPLPSSFRFTGSKSHAIALRDLMVSKYFPTLENVEVDGEKLELPKVMPWYPDQLGWTSPAARSALRKVPELSRFHRFLVAETEVGNVSRQEAVSMIPVLLLDVKPEHNNADDPKVLQFDRVLCDVPCSGDGTLRKNKPVWKQWRELNGNGLHRLQCAILTRGCEVLKIGGLLVYSTCSFNPVENEAVVAEILKRGRGSVELVDVSSKLPELLRKPGLRKWKVITEDGVYEKLDEMKIEKQDHFKTMFPPTEEKAEKYKLERCLRIYPHLQNTGGFFVAVMMKTKKWGRLDRMQLRGGDVPVVDPGTERMDAEPAISDHNDERRKRELDDEDSTGPDAKKARTGDIGSAQPITEEASTPETSVNNSKTASNQKPSFSSLFQVRADNDAKKAGTGDAQRASEEASTLEPPAVDNPDALEENPNAFLTRGEDPFIFLERDSETVRSLDSFYKLSPEFPRDLFVVRSEKEKLKTIYFVSRSVKSVLSAENSKKLRVINTGIRMFTRNNGESQSTAVCEYRINNDGLLPIADHIGKDLRLQISSADTVVMLKTEYPKFELFSQELQEKFKELALGSCLLEFNPANEKDYHGSIQTPMVLPIWRANVSVSLLLSKLEKRSLMHRLTGEELPDMVMGLEKGQEAKDSKDGTVEAEGEEEAGEGVASED
ncbi:tRNA (cytosine(34)-C(5))-methyltransferase [Borealophlyctis nickersoniae]|nr:tRNA (cytosine(34)-C(5))-methyltransferase [Borealophlyctis nickersoniae]